MNNILTIAYVTEGTTDQRFLQNIIRKTFEEIALECEGEIEVYDPVYLESKKKDSFIEDIMAVCKDAFDRGINVLCVHADADYIDETRVLKNKINPAFEAVSKLESNKICKNLVAIIPIRMSEAWMLADKELLKDEMGTDKTNVELGIATNPEAIADPKSTIVNALEIAQAHLPRRRNKITIKELYQPIGQNVSIEKLEKLHSFRSFKSAVEAAFRKLNYLR